MKSGYLKSDDDGHWYLIPEDLISRWRELIGISTTSNVYEEMESAHNNLNSEFEKYRLSGGIEDLKITIK